MSRTRPSRRSAAVTAVLALGVTLALGAAPASALSTKTKSGGSLSGGSLNGGSLNGGSLNGGSLNGGSLNGGSLN
ncbi:MAG: Cytochrome c heme lyase subunit CcmH [uncultured Frankineae bacterium]|uniref:Cytochrome c heme lyase subunit CcmH n=1 Tax=uncultured Frankineae bacterium TaxID=437475 RepID=A0A6J4L447_9ACTN|nr:MAG: Cytochrome c heme lyase subunit CcmH [uncultured Frankineae bacterium]